MSSRKNAEKLQLAFSYHRIGNLDEAAKLYRQIIRREPSNVHALGVIEAGRGNIREAAPPMSRSVLLQPANLSFIENYAMVLCLLGDYAAALDISLEAGNPRMCCSVSTRAA
jgi:protein O-GlcNAc transferase